MGSLEASLSLERKESKINISGLKKNHNHELYSRALLQVKLHAVVKDQADLIEEQSRLLKILESKNASQKVHVERHRQATIQREKEKDFEEKEKKNREKEMEGKEKEQRETKEKKKKEKKKQRKQFSYPPRAASSPRRNS